MKIVIFTFFCAVVVRPIIVIFMIWLSDTWLFIIFGKCQKSNEFGWFLTANKSQIKNWKWNGFFSAKLENKRKENLAFEKPTIIRNDYMECWLNVDKRSKLTRAHVTFLKRRFVAALRLLPTQPPNKETVDRTPLIAKSLVRNRYFVENKNCIPAYRNR